MDRFEELAESFERVAGMVGAGDPTGALRPFVDACGWGRRGVHEPLLPSGVRHGVPFGVSFVVGEGAPEIRVFVEPQADPPSPAAYWEASLRVGALVAEQVGAADMSRLARVRDLFSRAWYAVAFRPDAPPAYRIYLCFAGDRAARERALHDALARLELDDTVARGPSDVPTILSLDLHAAPRTKLYVLMTDHVLDHPFARAMPGGEMRMGWLACHFLSRDAAPRVAWHYGAARHAHDDDALAARLRAFFAESAIDASPYDRVRAAVPFRHHFVSYQEIAGRPRVTVYLLPEVRR